MSAPYNQAPEPSTPQPAHQQTTPLSHPEATATPEPTAQAATVVGEVRFRMGDGPMRTVPPGPVALTLTATDATLSWQADDSAQSAAVPLHEYTRMVRDGAIKPAL